MADNTVIAAGKFKAECLKLMDEVHDFNKRVVITKHGKPIVKLVPYRETEEPLVGCMQGTVKILGDIVSPIDETWDAMQ